MVRRPGAGSRGTHKGARGRGLCMLRAAPGRAAAAWPTGRAGLHDPGLSLGSWASCLRAAGPREGGRTGPPPAAAAGGHTCHLGRGGDCGRERRALPGPEERVCYPQLCSEKSLPSPRFREKQQTSLPARCLPPVPGACFVFPERLPLTRCVLSYCRPSQTEWPQGGH